MQWLCMVEITWDDLVRPFPGFYRQEILANRVQKVRLQIVHSQSVVENDLFSSDTYEQWASIYLPLTFLATFQIKLVGRGEGVLYC